MSSTPSAAPTSPSPATAVAVLLEGFGRTPGLVRSALDGMSEDDLTRRIDPDANTIAWLVWHTARMQDGQITMAARSLGRDRSSAEQVWTGQGFDERFELDVDDRDVGYGMSSEEVARIHAPAELLEAYHQAVHDRTVAFLESLHDDDYAFVVDESYHPPVTLVSRLVSILQDAVQHLGQAAYVRGILQRT